VIQIGFSTTPGPLSWLIRRVTQSKVSHCWLLGPDDGEEVVWEADTSGFRRVPYAEFRASNQVLVIAAPAVDLGPAFESVKEKWLGTDYDVLGLVGSIFVPLGRWLHRRWRNPFASDDVQFCSEAIVRVLQAANHPGADSLDPSDTSPQDLLAFMQESGGDLTPPPG
jgi:hypothetical protein